MVRNGVRDGRFELGDMEDQVHGLHALWKSECARMRAGLCYDLKRTKVLLSQLLQWLGRAEVLGLNKG